MCKRQWSFDLKVVYLCSSLAMRSLPDSMSEARANDEEKNRNGSSTESWSYSVAACSNASFVLRFLIAGGFILPAISVKLAIVVSRLATMAA
jgi:hypothetical protein